MSDHIIYAKPVTVTEEKLKEALAKQARQKALKEALDRQILEAEKVKKEEARRARRDITAEADGNPVERKRTAASSPPSNPPAETKAKEPVVARYTFDFDDEQANYIKEAGVGVSKEEHRGDAKMGRSPRSQKEDASKRNAGQRIATPQNAGDGKPPISPRMPTPGGAADVGKRTPSSQSRQQRKEERDAKLAALARPKDRKIALRGAERAAVGGRGVSPAYQTNSLPADLGEYAFDMGGNAYQPNGVAAAGKRRVGNGRKGTAEEATYDTQSLPVDLVYKLGKEGAGFLEACGNGNRPRPLPLRGAAKRPGQIITTKRSPSGTAALRRVSSPEIERLVPVTPPAMKKPASAEYNTDCLPRDFSLDDEFTAQYIAAKNKANVERQKAGRPAPSSSRPPSHGELMPSKTGYTKEGRRMSPRTPGRPMGGVLPPLQRKSLDCDSSVIEMSAMLDAPGEAGYSGGELRPSPPASLQRQQPPHRAPVLARPASDKRSAGNARALSRESRGSGHSQDVERLQKQLDNRDNMVRRMREKEKSWEDQVQRLKAELRDARRKEREVAKGKPTTAVAAIPPRAETAPDPPSPSREAGQRQRHLSHERGTRDGLLRGGNARGAASHEAHRKPDFSKAHIFTPEEFRPITAPDFPEHSYVPAVDGERGKMSSTRAREHPHSTGDASPSPLAETAGNSSVQAIMEASLKLASLTTRQTTFGLLEEDASKPASIMFDHLAQFADAQIITQQQAESLWAFFCQLKGVPVRYDDDGHIARQVTKRATSTDGDGSHLSRDERDIHSLDSGSDGGDATERESECDDADDGARRNSSTTESAAAPETVTAGSPRTDYHQAASPVSAFLAPALRKKISRMHAAAAAAADSPGGGFDNFDDGARTDSFYAETQQRRPTPPASTGDEERPSGRRTTPTAAQTPPPSQGQQCTRSPTEKMNAGRATSSRSPVSRSSQGATVVEEDDDREATLIPGGQKASPSKGSGPASRGTRRTKLDTSTFDTSVELYLPSEHA